MYRLYDLGDKWQIHSSDFGAMEGSFRQIVSYMAIELGLSYDEIELAVVDMCKRGNNGAEFGVFKKFIFSFNREISNVG